MRTLRKKKDFNRLFKKGRGTEEYFLKVFFLRNEKKENRWAFVIPKTAGKKAVIRNKLRRAIKEWVRKQKSKSEKCMDVLFLVKKREAPPTNKKIYEELEKIYPKIFS